MPSGTNRPRLLPGNDYGTVGAEALVPTAEAHACRDADSRAFRRTVAGAFRPPDARARNGDP